MSSSGASATCRLEWRRSRWLPAALFVLAAAAIASLWLSELPLLASAIGSAIVCGYIGWQLRREWTRSDGVLAWQGGDTDWQIESNGHIESLRHVGVRFRGSLVVLTLADANGKQRRYAWWPDTLDARGRRALRLAISVKESITPTQPTLAQ
ncbi:MAG: hypothetical protein ABIT64_00890 [Lysobacteraceae bacterium]